MYNRRLITLFALTLLLLALPVKGSGRNAQDGEAESRLLNEMGRTTAHCAVCGHPHLVAGRLQSTGLVYFKPARTRFFVMSESLVPVKARVCPRCGYVQAFADTEKLDQLLVAKDRVPEEADTEETPTDES